MLAKPASGRVNPRGAEPLTPPMRTLAARSFVVVAAVRVQITASTNSDRRGGAVQNAWLCVDGCLYARMRCWHGGSCIRVTAALAGGCCGRP
jgi:hypothetical protein